MEQVSLELGMKEYTGVMEDENDDIEDDELACSKRGENERD